MFRRNYAKERQQGKGSFVRWRGNIWFQSFMMLLSLVAASILAIYITVFTDFIWHVVVMLKESIEGWYLQQDVNLNVKAYTEAYWNNLWPETAWDKVKNIDNIWIYVIGLSLWAYFVLQRVILQWYDWYNMFSDRSNDANHFASFYEIDSVYVLVPDRNKVYDEKPGQPVAHVHGLHWRMLKHHPILWIKQLLKAPLGLNNQVWPLWYRWLRSYLIARWPNKFADQLTVKGGFRGFYWIDPTPTHDIKTGATRSGKDQTQGYPLIDIMSRSKYPWNLIDTDAKNEDYKMTYKALRTRGFDVYAINIDEVSNSESFNPFQLALDYAMDEDIERAKIEVSKIAQIIASSADNNVWDKTAQATMESIILILLRLSMQKNDPTLATPASVVQFIESLTAFKDKQGEDGLTKYLNNLAEIDRFLAKNGDDRDPLTNAIRLLAGSYLGSTGDTKTSVMFTLQSQIKLFASETIARLTARSTITPLEMAFPRLLNVKLPKIYADQAAIITLLDNQGTFDEETGQYSKKELEFDKVQVSNSGVLNYPFKEVFPEDWTIKLVFTDTVNKKALRKSEVTINGIKTEKRGFTGEVLLDEYTQQPTFETQVMNVQRKLFDNASKTLRLDMPVDVSVKYSEKPKAVFIITPQDNDDYAGIATLYISQVYAVTTSLASKITRRKLTNPILYKLNEFSMFPRIPGFNNLLTRGLTYGHVVDIYLQSLSQLERQYEPTEVKEIRDNALNWIHILSPNQETNESVSEALGERQIQTESVNSQMGEDRLNRGNRHVNTENVHLLSAHEISQLLPNEQITIRLAKRTDKKGRDVRALPIFATGPLKMPNAWKNIGKSYNLNYFTTDMGIKSKTRHLTEDDLYQDFTPYYVELEDKLSELTADESNQDLADDRNVPESTTNQVNIPSDYSVYLSNLDLNEPLINQTDQNNTTILNDLIDMTHNVANTAGIRLSAEVEQSLRSYQFKTLTKGQFRDTYLNGDSKSLFEIEQVMLGDYDDDFEFEQSNNYARGRF